MFTPCGMERFFERFARSAGGPEGFREIGADVGMEVVGPPLASPDSD